MPADFDPAQLPDGEDISAAIEQAEQAETQREQWLASPDAVAARESSRTAYANRTAAEAEVLLATTFAEQFEVLDSDPARYLSDAQLLGPPTEDETAGAVKAEGDTALLDAEMPLRTENEEGELRKVDLSLEATADGFETANALVDVDIPDSAAEPIEVGEEGDVVEISQQGAAPEREANRFRGENIFYPNVLPDTDMLVSPTAGGVEIFNQLRSEASPETFRFEVNVPAGGALQGDGGGAEVVSGGEVIAMVRAPTAIDAQGTDVPVEMTVEGDFLAVHLDHRENDYAMPILLDPEWVLENNENWIYGQNHNALDMGLWAFNKNVAGMYGSTYCVYHCFGQPSNVRGLFVSGQSGTYWPNQFAQWSYSAPNTDSYVTSVTLSPWVRYDHGCDAATTQYRQPHDYFGIWNGSAWVQPPSINSANYYGNQYTLPYDGQAVIFGLGSGSGPNPFTIPCWRDIYVGGAHVWLDDWSQPVLTASSSGQWIDSAPVRLNVSGSDAGLGVRKFEAEALNKSGAMQKWETWHPCIGTRRSPCPQTWNLAEASQPQLTYDPSVLPEGIVQMSVTAYDAVLRKSATTSTITVRVDHAPPAIKLSGTITEQAALGTEKPGYTVRVDAEDGEWKDDELPSNDPTKDRAGVVSISEWVDGVKKNEYAPGCKTQNCAHFDEGLIEAASYAPGQHTLVVKATDALGHVGQSDPLIFTLGDPTAPALNVTGLPAENSVVGAIPDLISAAATDGGKGVTSLWIKLDNETLEKVDKPCSSGKCSLETDFEVDLSDYPAGTHDLVVSAADGAGNVKSVSRSIRLDPAPPTIDLQGALAELDGLPLEATSAALDVEAKDADLAGGEAGVQKIVVELDEEPVLTKVNECSSDCSSAEAEYEYEKGDTASDASGGGLNGAIEGAEWVPGKFGSALQFDGVDDYLVVPDSPELDFTDGFTLEAWVRPDVAQEDAPVLIKESSSIYAYRLDGGGVTKGTAEGMISDADWSWEDVESQDELPVGDWSHLALTYDGTDLRLYVDAELVDEEEAPPAQMTSGALKIGGSKFNDFFDGRIDEVRLYDEGLTEAEIEEDAETAVAPEEQEPVAAYSLDDDEPHTLSVEAIDKAGNTTSETITINIDPSASTSPECNTQTDMEAAQGVLTPAQAVDAIEEALPAAVAPTNGAIAPPTEETIDPSYSAPSPNLETVDSLATGETSVTPEGGFTLGGSACFTPATLTPAASDATVVSGDAALFANTAPETDTVIRPTAMGTTVIHSLRGPEAPESFTWNVTLAAGQELVEMPSGAVAVVEVGSEAEDVAEVPSPPGKSAADLADVEVQVENSEYELINAAEETQQTVVAVIARPWVVLAQGGIVPALIEVAPVIETPNEFEVIVRPPETDEEAAVWPVQLIIDTASSSSVNGNCSKSASPCGALDLNKAAQYAVYWANEEHHFARNPYYADYGSNNCTNFISQVLRAGGAKFMKAFDKGDGSWWYRNFASGGIFGDGPTSGWEDTNSWRQADMLPRHLWRFGLVHIDPVQQPLGWTKGNIIALDWIGGGDPKGNVDHLQFVVGTVDTPGGREPLIANSSSSGANYPHMRWENVKKRIEGAHGSGWNRFALAAKHRVANLEAKKHAPENLYGPNGLFQG